ncbi:MAG: hypothetical protein DRI54_02615 [Bacteroidetes bacterium]|nr:MAG: hypothetical protein DRI54_02615 [Bacteroidota bacterium]
MCTLTFVPTTNGVILTSNRDEHDSRGNTLFPVNKIINNKKVVFPQDPKAGGTWIACSSDQSAAVLLNGAFKKHKHKPPYRKSRGLVLLDLFKFKTLEDFNDSYDLKGIEPFTIVYFKKGEPSTLNELRWDGTIKYMAEFDVDHPHIWSSATLYSPKIILERQQWFAEMLETKETSSEQLQHFHEFGGNSDAKNNFKMNRGKGLRTISISQINITKQKIGFRYQNLVNDTIDKISLKTDSTLSHE